MNIFRPKNMYYIWALYFLGACILFLLLYFHSSAPVTEVDLLGREIIPEENESPAIVFAVAPVLTPERTIEDYLTLSGFLSRQLQMPVKIIQRKTYLEVNELLRTGKVHLALICTGAFIHAISDNIPLQIIAVPVHNGNMHYRSLLITRYDSPIHTITDLHDKSFAYSDPLSLSGYLYPYFFFMEKGITPQNFFSNTIFTYSHNGCLNLILDKIVDAGAVNNLIYEYELEHNDNFRHKFRIMHRSFPIGITPVVTGCGVDSILRTRIQDVFLGMDENNEGVRLLAKFSVDKFEIPLPNIYDSAIYLFGRYQDYMKGNKLKPSYAIKDSTHH